MMGHHLGGYWSHGKGGVRLNGRAEEWGEWGRTLRAPSRLSPASPGASPRSEAARELGQSFSSDLGGC